MLTAFSANSDPNAVPSTAMTSTSVMPMSPSRLPATQSDDLHKHTPVFFGMGSITVDEGSWGGCTAWIGPHLRKTSEAGEF
jgi:hypothetical protein